MLEKLTIKNFAIIENTEIDFLDKMTVLTGETGAGKTIIIESISLLLGERANKDMIRHNTDKAFIEGVFSYDNPLIDEVLVKLGIDLEEQLIISRTITKDSSNIRINNMSVSLASLKMVTRYLIDIHLQHDSVRFLAYDNYVSVIDRYQNNNALLAKYQVLLHNFRNCLKEYNKLKKEAKTMNEKIDFMRFQLDELNKLELSVAEYEDLLISEKRLKNFDKIYLLVKEVNDLIDNASIDSLYDITTTLEDNELISDGLKNASSVIKSAYYDLTEAKSFIKNEFVQMEYDPAELEMINLRLYDYERTSKKYHLNVLDLIDFQKDLFEKINNHDNLDEFLKEKEEALKKAFDDLLDHAFLLSKARKAASIKLKKELEAHLSDLSLTSVFEVKFDQIPVQMYQDDFLDSGIDEVDFLISTNKGEPLKPLKKTASGGELSRFMLALKVILIKSEKLSTVIFDEIDSGVSGLIAHSMASKIKLIAKDTQVLLITHLPQVASSAHHHIHVSKEIKEGRTISKTKYLDYDNKVKEIAKMLSGEHVSEESLIQAQKLINNE